MLSKADKRPSIDSPRESLRKSKGNIKEKWRARLRLAGRSRRGPISWNKWREEVRGAEWQSWWYSRWRREARRPNAVDISVENHEVVPEEYCNEVGPQCVFRQERSESLQGPSKTDEKLNRKKSKKRRNKVTPEQIDEIRSFFVANKSNSLTLGDVKEAV